MLRNRLQNVCSRYSDRVALRWPNSQMTYRELWSSVDNLSNQITTNFKQLGIQPSAAYTYPIAVFGPKSQDMVLGVLGAWCAGHIAVPMCVSHSEAERNYVLNDTTAIMAIKDREVSLLPSRNPKDILKGSGADRLIIYTSGTTGKPKGVVHTNSSLMSQITVLQNAWEWSHKDVTLNNLPMHHIHGLMNVSMCSVYSGATVEFSPFSKDETLQYLSDSDINVYMAVPTIYAKLIESFDGKGLSDVERSQWSDKVSKKIRLFVSGSSALPASLKKRFETISKCHILERYGMTETGMILSQTYSDVKNGKAIAGTVGVPLPTVSVNVDSLGQLAIQSSMLFDRYWNRPAEVTKKEFQGKFFVTGDTVNLDAATGQYSIMGRTSVDIVKVGGYKISTLDIESVLLEALKTILSEVCVFGVPDETYGEKIVAMVVPFEGKVVTEETVLEACRKNLSPYKVPRVVVVRKSPLPRNAMGKVSKKEIAKLYLSESK